MSSVLKPPTKPVEDWEQVRDEWVQAVEQLVGDIEGWCKTAGWPTRRIVKRVKESAIGEYVVPALLIQDELTKILVEPLARFVQGADGAVDVYKMPEYDDIATAYRADGGWRLHDVASGDAEGRPLDELEFAAVVARMSSDA